MPTNPNMEAIQTVTVGAGGASTIDFQNIPQTYTDLVILLSARQSTTSFQGQRLYFNNTDTNLRSNYVLGTGSGTQAGAPANGYFGSIAGTNVSASVFDNTFIYISNYTSTSLVKTFSAENIAPSNDNLAYLGITNGTWNSTSAITRVTLFPDGGGSYLQYSSATLYGVTSAAVGAKATGGIISQDNTYWYHTFTASGTFTPTSNITADYLVVAGGGGGGNADGTTYNGGGGGAGGLRCTVTATGGGGTLESPISLTASTAYTITIGAGGASNTPGENSSILGTGLTTITSIGGGRGKGANSSADGGSGGGGSATSRAGGSRTTNQGYDGGASTSGFDSGGGGGGAGAVGTAGASTGGNGGAGVTTSISGSSVTYAGGGGGGAATPGSGGLGGGGAGGNPTGTAGTANSGGGGGGVRDNVGGQFRSGAAGGSGIVILRYAK
jgi:hypothetical protein